MPQNKSICIIKESGGSHAETYYVEETENRPIKHKKNKKNVGAVGE
jgi:hypothetical protein